MSWNPLNWIKTAWSYSRTIVVNVIGMVSMFMPDIVGYFSTFDFDAVFKHEVAVIVGSVVFMLNMLIRFYTVAPVGASADARIAAVQAVADVHEEEEKLAVDDPEAAVVPLDADADDASNIERSVKAE